MKMFLTRINRTILTIAVGSCLCFSAVMGQDADRLPRTEQVVELWSGASIKKELFNDLNASLEHQIRLNDNLQSFKSSLTNIGVRYKLHKKVRLGTYYRFSIKPRGNEHRSHTDLNFRYRKKPYTFSLRTRYQRVWPLNELTEQYWRNKLKLEYKYNKRTFPYIAAEFYYRIHHQGNFIDKYRLYAGMDYEISDKHLVNFFYMFQREVQVYAPGASHVLGLNYELGL